ncbi:hypothetical protein N9D55_07495 [Flavobacteriaceae bacterium]|nr:hypothetical protein [Flavobacteriaceae bacterium]
MRTETKHLFNEGVSPNIKSLILKSRAGLPLNENEKRKLNGFNESVSMVEIPKNRKGVVPKKPPQEPNEDEIDLETILIELGYGDTDDLRDDYHEEVEDDDNVGEMSREELKELIQSIVMETLSEQDDINEIIENLTR